MKHVVNRSKSAVKPKAKTLTQNKAVARTKPAAKKPIAKIAAVSLKKSPVQNVKAAVVKITPKVQTRVVKPAEKKTAAKISSNASDASKLIAVRKAKSAARLTAKSAVKAIEKSKAKKNSLKQPAKAIKTPVKKTILLSKKLSGTEKKVAPEQKTKKSSASKIKPQILGAKATVVVKTKDKTAAKTSLKQVKSPSLKIAVQPTKHGTPKVETGVSAKKKAAAKKAKSNAVATTKKPAIVQKTKPAVALKKPTTVKKPKPIADAKIVKGKKAAPITASKKINEKSKKAAPVKVASAAISKKPVKKTIKIQPAVAEKKIVTKILKAKPAISAASFNKPKPKVKRTVAIKPIEAIEAVKDKIEFSEPRPEKPVNRKARPISSAVFRGKKERYDFKVFELNEKFEPVPAVFIISKRKIDRRKKGHHALICIGQTSSISDELKRHRKGKCVKKHQANVVSILAETDEKVRRQIETDLKAAHSVICNLD